MCECDQVRVSFAAAEEVAPLDDRWRQTVTIGEGELSGVFERWSLQTSDGRSVYRNGHNILGWSQELYLYFESRWKRWIITTAQYHPGHTPDAPSLEYLIAQSSSGDEAVCPEAAAGWQHVTVAMDYPSYGGFGGYGPYVTSYGGDLPPIGVVCEDCPVASLSSWRVFNLEYQLDEVFQQGGQRDIQLALERSVTNALPYPAPSGGYEFTSTVSNSFSFELAAQSVSISGTANSDSNTDTETVDGPGRRLLAWGPILMGGARIATSVIPVSANTPSPP